MGLFQIESCNIFNNIIYYDKASIKLVYKNGFHSVQKEKILEFLDETIGIGLKKRAEKTPNNLAVITDEHRYTWLEIDLMSDYLAVQMMKKGIK